MILTLVQIFTIGFFAGFAVAATLAARDFKRLRDMMNVSNAALTGGEAVPSNGVVGGKAER